MNHSSPRADTVVEAGGSTAAKEAIEPANEVVMKVGPRNFLQEQIWMNRIKRLGDVHGDNSCTARRLSVVEALSYPVGHGKKSSGRRVKRAKPVLIRR